MIVGLLRARMGLWLLLLLDEPKTHCPSFECPTELGCSVTRERYTGCPHCQCGHINSATVSDDRERRKPLIIEQLQECPRLRCPLDSGCYVRQRPGKCPYCKCAVVGGHSCPPIRSCPEEYGCHVRQRVGKCPFCKCGFMKQVPRPTGNRRT
ncbi:uncharacterized protein LOC144166357 isoform X1 [Haemaphysalis longicornis]